MKPCIIALILNLAVTCAASAQHAPSYEGLVESWYHRYLRRHADPIGIRNHVTELRRGTPVDFVEASILGSDEYWLRNGGTPDAFIAALYRDVTGVYPPPRDQHYWVQRYVRTGSRHLLALRFLQENRLNSMVRPPTYPDYDPGHVPSPPPIYVPGTVPTSWVLPGHLVPDRYPERSNFQSGAYRNLPFKY